MLFIGEASSTTMDVVTLDIANTSNLLDNRSMFNIIATESLSRNEFIVFQSIFHCFEIKMRYDGTEIQCEFEKLILDQIDVITCKRISYIYRAAITNQLILFCHLHLKKITKTSVIFLVSRRALATIISMFCQSQATHMIYFSRFHT